MSYLSNNDIYFHPQINRHISLNSRFLDIDYEKQEFIKFSHESKKKEYRNFIFYYILYVFPSIYYIINIFKLQWFNLLYLFTIGIIFEMFYFITGHLNVHQTMLLGYQNGIIKSPWAYYHHYVHSLLYSKIPFGYRLSADKLFLLFNISSLLFNINELIFGIILIIGNIDYLAHEYQHSYRRKHYTSYNPFSSKFIGIYIIMRILENIYVLDVRTHSEIHHKEKSSTMHLTDDWLDLKPYYIWYIANFYAKFEWFLFKKCIEVTNGTSNAEHISNLTLKSKLLFLCVDLFSLLKVIFLTYIISFLNFTFDSNMIDIRYFLCLISFIHIIFYK